MRKKLQSTNRGLLDRYLSVPYLKLIFGLEIGPKLQQLSFSTGFTVLILQTVIIKLFNQYFLQFWDEDIFFLSKLLSLKDDLKIK